MFLQSFKNTRWLDWTEGITHPHTNPQTVIWENSVAKFFSYSLQSTKYFQYTYYVHVIECKLKHHREHTFSNIKTLLTNILTQKFPKLRYMLTCPLSLVWLTWLKAARAELSSLPRMSFSLQMKGLVVKEANSLSVPFFMQRNKMWACMYRDIMYR